MYYHMMNWLYGRCEDVHTEDEMRTVLKRYIKGENRDEIIEQLLTFGEPNEHGFYENQHGYITVRKFV